MMEHLTCLPWVTTNECVQMTYFTNPWEFTSVCGGYIGTCYIKFWTYRQTAWFFSLMRLSSHASSALFSQRFVAHLSRRYMRFYPNVTTLRSGLCCRNSVCLSVCRLSVCLSVCNVGAPYSRVEAFGNISSPLCTLAIIRPLRKILRRSSKGNPPSGALNARGVSK